MIQKQRKLQRLGSRWGPMDKTELKLFWKISDHKYDLKQETLLNYVKHLKACESLAFKHVQYARRLVAYNKLVAQENRGHFRFIY